MIRPAQLTVKDKSDARLSVARSLTPHMATGIIRIAHPLIRVGTLPEVCNSSVAQI